MVVAPGWSFGDIIAAAKLIKQIIDGFNEAHGARENNRQNFLFLKSLYSNLNLISNYFEESTGSAASDALQQQLDVIHEACDRFQIQMKKHHGLHPLSTSRVRRAWDTVKWTFVNDDIDKLRSEVSETLMTLHLRLTFEATLKMDTLHDHTSQSFGRVSENLGQMEENITLDMQRIMLRQERLESATETAPEEWRQDVKDQSKQAQESTTAMVNKMEHQAKALEDMQSDTQSLVKRVESSIALAERNLRERQISLDKEAAAMRAEQQQRLLYQKTALEKVKQSSQDAMRQVDITVDEVRTSGRNLERIGRLLADLDGTLKALSVSSFAARMLRELKKFNRKVRKESQDAAVAVREQARKSSNEVHSKWRTAWRSFSSVPEASPETTKLDAEEQTTASGPTSRPADVSCGAEDRHSINSRLTNVLLQQRSQSVPEAPADNIRQLQLKPPERAPPAPPSPSGDRRSVSQETSRSETPLTRLRATVASTGGNGSQPNGRFSPFGSQDVSSEIGTDRDTHSVDSQRPSMPASSRSSPMVLIHGVDGRQSNREGIEDSDVADSSRRRTSVSPARSDTSVERRIAPAVPREKPAHLRQSSVASFA